MQYTCDQKKTDW